VSRDATLGGAKGKARVAAIHVWEHAPDPAYRENDFLFTGAVLTIPKNYLIYLIQPRVGRNRFFALQ